MSINIGSQAPDFTLKTKTPEGIKDVTLSHNLGKKQTLILFVPLAFTPVCTKQFCQATTDYSFYQNLDAEIYGISVDSPFSQAAWAKSENMGITLLSDMQKEVSTAYGVLDKELLGLGGVSRRSAFIVNKDGIITYKWISAEPQEYPPFEAIKAALQSEKACATA